MITLSTRLFSRWSVPLRQDTVFYTVIGIHSTLHHSPVSSSEVGGPQIRSANRKSANFRT
jgi:hypothetical protein